MISTLDRYFGLSKHQTTFRTDVLAGLTTFLTMSYIIFVQPAILIVVGIPLTFSIADGLALGFIAYPIVKLLAGQGRDVKWLMYLMAVVLAVYFVLVRSAAA